MKATLNGAWELDGRFARARHPETGHEILIDGVHVQHYEMTCTLDGEPCACVMADEEAGVVEVPVLDERGQHVVCEKVPGSLGQTQMRTTYKTGKVQIQVTPIRKCTCEECLWGPQ